ncbi:type 4 pilus major pilin [Salipiger mucosus]|uniref:type 4 pilus major pilin n=1 Tax=Salipiger mucosus TaxID=263378 RepID=UPI00035F0246|nr:type 4 pilus major pilin [Salipiger mucosus]
MASRRNHPCKLSQRGIGLLQIALCLIVAASIVAGVMMKYSRMQEDQDVDTVNRQVMAIHDEIARLYANRPNFDGVTPEYVAVNGNLPESMIRSSAGTTELVSPFGKYEISPISIDCGLCQNTFYVNVRSIPRSMCARIARTAVASTANRIRLWNHGHGTFFEERPTMSQTDSVCQDPDWKPNVRFDFIR